MYKLYTELLNLCTQKEPLKHCEAEILNMTFLQRVSRDTSTLNVVLIVGV